MADTPESLGIAQVRVARPTDRLDEVVRFYVEGVGLRELSRFVDHAGYSGVMVGSPMAHLEFTTHVDGSPGAAPSAENLLVLYFDDAAAMDAVVRRRQSSGQRRWWRRIRTGRAMAGWGSRIRMGGS